MKVKDCPELLRLVRVMIDHDAVRDMSFTIKKVCSEGDLRKLQMPWYKGASDQFDVPYNFERAAPVRVGQVADDIERWSNKKAGIQCYVNKFRSEELINATVPGYALGNDNTLLLDGNHRAVALVRTGRPFLLNIKVIEGPINPAILPDLAHWRH